MITKGVNRKCSMGNCSWLASMMKDFLSSWEEWPYIRLGCNPWNILSSIQSEGVGAKGVAAEAWVSEWVGYFVRPSKPSYQACSLCYWKMLSHLWKNRNRRLFASATRNELAYLPIRIRIIVVEFRKLGHVKSDFSEQWKSDDVNWKSLRFGQRHS